jgi:hypothetical protein
MDEINKLIGNTENLRLRVALKQAWFFIEHLKHRGKCQAGCSKCLNCEADKFHKEFPWVKNL